MLLDFSNQERATVELINTQGALEIKPCVNEVCMLSQQQENVQQD